jgi:diguanylate cyclase (GGDEF)-like protein
VEAVARQVSNVIRSSRDYERERAPALRDSLTGLPNVERLHQFAATLANADGKLEGQCSVLFIDVDGLKDVNRELGRAAGDRLLAGVVEAIRRALRGADFLFRFRSDEFVVYLAQTDFTTSVNIASRIKAAVRQGDLGKHAQGMAFSVSVGVSSLPQDGGTLDALIAEAKGRAMASKSGHPPSRLERDSIH